MFNTHVHGDHWLGNDAIRKDYPKAKIYAHPKARSAIAAGEGAKCDRATKGTT